MLLEPPTGWGAATYDLEGDYFLLIFDCFFSIDLSPSNLDNEMTVRIKDNGWTKLLKSMLKDDKAVVHVGIQGEDASKGHPAAEGLTVAEVGEIHEFGLGVHKRSFLRGYFDENRSFLVKRLRNVAKRVANPRSKLTMKKGLDIFGFVVVGGIQNRMEKGIWPPLSQAAIELRMLRHGARKIKRSKKKPTGIPLIDTGQLRSSITHRVKL